MDTEIGSGSQHKKEFINKVAEKLGVSPEKVAAALQDARKERIDQAVKERIDQAVKDGVITQAEAGRISEWWKSRPDGVRKLWLGHMHGHALCKGGMKGFQK